MIFGGRAFEEKLVHEDGDLMMGLVPFQKETKALVLSLSTERGHSEKTAIGQPGGGPAPGTGRPAP